MVVRATTMIFIRALVCQGSRVKTAKFCLITALRLPARTVLFAKITLTIILVFVLQRWAPAGIRTSVMEVPRF